LAYVTIFINAFSGFSGDVDARLNIKAHASVFVPLRSS